MNDVSELKQFAVVHARSLNIKRYQEVLDRIDNDREGAPGSWARVWTEAGDELAEAGRALDASRRYALARFPYPDGPARAQAGKLCVAAFDAWRQERPGIERLDVELPAGRVGCWATGLSAAKPLPLLLVMGGVVTLKEQLGPALVLLRRLGVAAVVTEMPGVGENTLPYDAESWRQLSAVIDAVADRADVSRTYAYTFSFSGHLALRCAAEDARIKSVITSGAPVREFFLDREWLGGVPQVTLDTLSHLAGAGRAELAERLSALALTDEQLDRVRVPVSYLASRRDEIIPAGETRLLQAHVAELKVLENDDVHASPKHIADSLLWLVLTVLKLRGRPDPRRLPVAALWLLLRARHRLTRSPR
ncbi:MAG: alpha/beta hydrolase [Catenulispora sp.]|nr:alpha/beta hydrolase [Catenulispora sp.]